MTNKETPSTQSVPQTDDQALVIVDLGKQKRKNVRRLRKGQGKLFDRVKETISRLQSEGVIRANSQPLVLVVRERFKSGTWMGLG